MRSVTLTPRRPSRSRRGVMFLWFFAIALPLLFVGFGLAADVSAMVTINRSVRLAAESASVAGSFQYERNGSGFLDPNSAVAAANETFQHALAVGGVSRADNVQGTAEVQYQTVDGISRAVGVRYYVSYRSTGFVILNYWLAATGGSSERVSISERAQICNPTTSTSGFCGRPDTDRYEYGTADGGDGYGAHYPAHYTPFYAPQYPTHYPPHYTGHYPAHYTGHYPAHYPAHYTGHYPAHYPRHYPRHYPSHYAGFQGRR